jgi:hypothetical protein
MESLVLLGELSPPRPRTLAEVADVLEAYMRSPAFLENMRLGLRVLSSSWLSSSASARARKKGLG